MMSEINDRIAKVVVNSGLSKTGFALKINVTPAYISKLVKSGTPSDSTIADICREFHVNETWLRTGEGEMLVPQARDDEISQFFANLMEGTDPTFKRRLISVLARLDEDQWEMLERKAWEIVGMQEMEAQESKKEPG